MSASIIKMHLNFEILNSWNTQILKHYTSESIISPKQFSPNNKIYKTVCFGYLFIFKKHNLDI